MEGFLLRMEYALCNDSWIVVVVVMMMMMTIVDLAALEWYWTGSVKKIKRSRLGGG